METLKIHDRKFTESINSRDIQAAVDKIASALNHDFANKEVVFIAILNGAFMFASDLLKKITFDCRISFIKFSSYEGTESTGKVQQLIGINEVLKDKHVVIIEDIIDSGNTLNLILHQLHDHHPAEIRVASLLFKPDSFGYEFIPDYTGFHIPNEFVVGYGLDYNGFGRNLESIFTVVNET